MLKTVQAAAALTLALLVPAAAQEPTVGYAPINGLEMYYEVHGEGEPIVLLHGAYMSIPSNWGALIPTLTQAGRQVIAVELQAHGRTNDRDTPITYEGMADDVAALLDYLKIDDAALFGYSLGTGVAFQVALRHPEKVNRLIAASGSIAYEGYPDGFYEMIESLTPEMFAGSPMEQEYLKLSPNKDGFPNLFAKLRQLDLDRFAWPEAEVAAIGVPTLLIFGDADAVEMDHIAKMHALLGGFSNGDMNGLAKVQLAILPGTSHIGVMFNPANIELLKQIVPSFLAAEIPAPPQMPM